MSLYIFAAWVVLAAMVGRAAVARGRSGIIWSLFALIFSPLIGLLLLIASPIENAELEARRQQADDDKALARNIRIGRKRLRL